VKRGRQHLQRVAPLHESHTVRQQLKLAAQRCASQAQPKRSGAHAAAPPPLQRHRHGRGVARRSCDAASAVHCSTVVSDEATAAVLDLPARMNDYNVPS
jgi:hypothetical protein